jgi:hypothetical protein
LEIKKKESLIMNLKPTSPSLFPIGSKLQHRKTGGFYQVMGIAIIEATLEPAYVYLSHQTHDYWVRPQAEMEDGRFVLIP